MLPVSSALTESQNAWYWERPLNSTNSWSLQPRLALTFPSPTRECDIQQITSPLCLHLDEKGPAALQEPLLCCPFIRYWAGWSSPWWPGPPNVDLLLSVESLIWFFCWGSNPLVLPGQAAYRNHRPTLTLFNLHPQSVICLLKHLQAEHLAFQLFYHIKGNSTSFLFPACAS